MIADREAKVSALLEGSAVIRNEVEVMKNSLIIIRNAIKNVEGLTINPVTLQAMETLIDEQMKTDLRKLEGCAEVMEEVYKKYNNAELYGPLFSPTERSYK